MAQDNALIPVVGFAALIGAAYLFAQRQTQQTQIALLPPSDLQTSAYDEYQSEANAVQQSILNPSPQSASTQFFPTIATSNAGPASRYTTSIAGQNNIIHFEGRSYVSYQSNGVWHIGIGHKIVPGDGLSLQSSLIDSQVIDLFYNDLSIAEQAIKSYVTAPITQGQFDALIDFTFNEGSGALASSTLLSLLNARNYDGAAAEFSRWIYAHDAAGNAYVVSDLVSRRQADQSLFVS